MGRGVGNHLIRVGLGTFNRAAIKPGGQRASLVVLCYLGRELAPQCGDLFDAFFGGRAWGCFQLIPSLTETLCRVARRPDRHATVVFNQRSMYTLVEQGALLLPTRTFISVVQYNPDCAVFLEARLAKDTVLGIGINNAQRDIRTCGSCHPTCQKRPPWVGGSAG